MSVHRAHVCVTCLILTNPARRPGRRSSPAFHRRNSGSEKMNSHKAGPRGSPVGPFSDSQFQGIPHHGALPRNNRVMSGFMRPQGREPVLWKCLGKKLLAAMVGLKPRAPHSRPGFLGAVRVHIEHFRPFMVGDRQEVGSRRSAVPDGTQADAVIQDPTSSARHSRLAPAAQPSSLLMTADPQPLGWACICGSQFSSLIPCPSFKGQNFSQPRNPLLRPARNTGEDSGDSGPLDKPRAGPRLPACPPRPGMFSCLLNSKPLLPSTGLPSPSLRSPPSLTPSPSQAVGTLSSPFPQNLTVC